MERYTRNENGKISAEPSVFDLNGTTIGGLGIERLSKFEDFLGDLLKERDKINAELEQLRLEDKNKSVRYREAFTKKLINTNILILVKRYGLIQDIEEKAP